MFHRYLVVGGRAFVTGIDGSVCTDTAVRDQFDEMPRVYRAGDALVLPSRAEGMPQTVIEAMALGGSQSRVRLGGDRRADDGRA